MKPRVVNLRDYRVARNRYALPDGVVRVDRRTPWGNPFGIGQVAEALSTRFRFALTRDGAIGAYATWLADRLAESPMMLDELRGATAFACWCEPAACHAEILAIAVDEGEAGVRRWIAKAA